MDSKEDFSTGIMKRPLEQEDDDSSMKRARGSGPKIELRILLQSKNAGAIIGKGGSNIKRLREHFKASVTVPDCTGPERILTIGADIDTALDCLADIIPSLEDYKQFSNDEYDCEIRILVHQSQAGCIIGRAGFKIKELREKTGANIKVYSTCCAQSTDRVVAISGRPPVVIACINVIYELLEMAPPKGVNQPYDPHNYDEYYAHDYGGYTIAEGGRGKLPRGAPPPPPRGGVSPLMSPQIRGRGTAGGMGDMGMGGSGSMSRGGLPSLTGGRNNMGAALPYGSGGGGSGGRDDGLQELGGMRNAMNGSMGARAGRGGDNRFGNPARGNSGQGFYGGQQNFAQDSMGGMGNQGMMFGMEQTTTTQVTIPKELAGAIIGRCGTRITDVRRQSGAQVVIDEALPGSSDRIITITGTQEQIDAAQFLLQSSVRKYSDKF
ncbi:heterogeneous nuclear ribonucleoprotein K isoform X2 [Octopus bimaculoides]|uniref:Heterogeneous nuclear ribonucleoprotein K isoform X2 n=1 Tax=Octopus sinensis TaxID=2607531 RepID=A0A6P7T870_9MOLL|nr:heterogeneous nuclear ribonucleoprotein K isoform X2 [Octopus bimaculoides]XP_029646442.1 heterogeneous nuclear ribonucleoprotein K isoform X2 [Octopus sinensis]|eukprot:XP_014786470.1 PREDICTED: heterogeneous nuclear ribonucleoprotein K-like isoform X3 [Octopus bimaculoides]